MINIYNKLQVEIMDFPINQLGVSVVVNLLMKLKHKKY